MATVQNAMGLLNLFSQSRPEIGLTEFKQLSGFDKGTTHRYLKALKSIGYLEQNSETKAYRLGPTVVRLAAIREQTFPITKIAAIHVDELANNTGELAHAALPTEEGMSSLHHRDGGISGTRVGFDAAEILPLHATSSGITMLAFGPSDLAAGLSNRKLNKFTANTDTDPDSIRKTVEETRAQGYSAMNQSYEAEVCSVAVPFFGNQEHASGSLAIATPRSRMTDEAKFRLLASAIETSRSISAELGAQIPSALDGKWDKIQKKALAL